MCELPSLGNSFSMLVKPELTNDSPPNVMRFHLLTFSEFYLAFLRGIESPRWIQDLFTFFSCLGNSSRNSHHLADGERGRWGKWLVKLYHEVGHKCRERESCKKKKNVVYTSVETSTF